MTNEALSNSLRSALEALIAEAQAKPANALPTEAERAAVLAAGKQARYGRGR